MPPGSHRDRSTLLVLLVVGLGLALVRLADKSLWLDECFSLWRAPLQSDWWMGEHPVRWSTILENIARRDAHPPLYYLLLKLWRELGGVGGDEVWPRLLSAAFQLGTIAFVHRLLARHASSLQAAVGGGLVALSCLAVQFSQEARNYGLSILLAAAATYFFFGILNRRRGSAWAYALCTLLGMYTYYYLAFLFAAQAAVIVVRTVRERDLRPWLWRWLAGQVAAAALFAPWALWVLPEKIGQVSETTGIAARLLTLEDLGALATVLLAGEPDWKLKPLAVGALALLLLLQVVAGWRSKDPLAGLLATCFVGCVVLLALFPAKGHEFEGKHLAFLLPLVCCAIAWTVDTRKRTWVLPAAFVAVNLVSLAVYYPQPKQDWRAATGHVWEQVTEGDVVLFNPFYLRVPFFHYYTGQGDPAGRRFVPGYTHRVGEKVALPPNMQRNAYLAPEDFRPTRRHDLWIVEVHGSAVAAPEPRVHDWSRAFYVEGERRSFDGLYGKIVLTRYRPR